MWTVSEDSLEKVRLLVTDCSKILKSAGIMIVVVDHCIDEDECLMAIVGRLALVALREQMIIVEESLVLPDSGMY